MRKFEGIELTRKALDRKAGILFERPSFFKGREWAADDDGGDGYMI